MRNILTFFVPLLLPFVVFSATLSESAGGSIMFEMNPKNPGIFEQTQITLTSYELNLDKSKITWYVNNKSQTTGTGNKTFTFKTGAAGEKISIGAVIPYNGKNVARIITINPAGLDLIWNAETYTPPIYRGKAMVSPRSNVKVSAIPKFVTENGSPLNPKDLSYEWKKDNLKIASGRGQDSVKIQTGGSVSQTEVSLKVTNDDKSIVAEKTIIIAQDEPEVVLYEDNALDGTDYNNSVKDGQNFYKKEFSIRAEPYFFSFPEAAGRGNLQINWTMNSSGFLPNDGTPKIVTLRNESNKELLSNLGLNIVNLEKLTQKSSININLKSSPSVNF